MIPTVSIYSTGQYRQPTQVAEQAAGTGAKFTCKGSRTMAFHDMRLHHMRAEWPAGECLKTAHHHTSPHINRTLTEIQI